MFCHDTLPLDEKNKRLATVRHQQLVGN